MLSKTFLKEIQKKITSNLISKNLVTLALVVLFWGRFETLTSATKKGCIYDNRTYPNGTIIGDYKCNDGRWERIK